MKFVKYFDTDEMEIWKIYKKLHFRFLFLLDQLLEITNCSPFNKVSKYLISVKMTKVKDGKNNLEGSVHCKTDAPIHSQFNFWFYVWLTFWQFGNISINLIYSAIHLSSNELLLMIIENGWLHIGNSCMTRLYNILYSTRNIL